MTPYLQRILALLDDRDPITVLEATPTILEGFLEALAPSDLERSYAAGKWTAREIYAHLADVELGMGFRLRQTAAQSGGEVQPFDQDAWARRYGRLEPSIALESFRALRAWNLALFSTFDFEDWMAEALHPERGGETIDLMVRFLAGHDLNHLHQLERIASGEGV